jgi:hypothetical protein
MNFEYSTYEELFNLIKQINEKYYAPFNANILYLEELENRIYVIYIIEHRDAYSHLVRIFDYDIFSEEGRQNVHYHLNEYVTHLQRGLFDTFRKILYLETQSLEKSIHKNDLMAVRTQIAREAAGLRVMDKTRSIDEKIEGYGKLIDFISKIRTKMAS